MTQPDSVSAVRCLHRGWFVPALVLFAAGCATIPAEVRQLPDDALSIELVDTPFFAQSRYQCGPAALTTVLVSSDAEVSLDEIVRKVYLPGRKGSLQLEMQAAVRTSGRVPYVLDGSLSALADELLAGRPVVVLQNLGISWLPRWHYAVVVGIDAQTNDIVLRSGTDRRRVADIEVFLQTWARSDYWALTVLRPDELPTNVERVRYFEQIVALENLGMAEMAAAAWRAALQYWPGEITALFGLGNARSALDDYAGAEVAYRQLLTARPGLAAARNNLALVLARQGDIDAAMKQVERAIQDNDDLTLHDELENTRAEILEIAERSE